MSFMSLSQGESSTQRCSLVQVFKCSCFELRCLWFDNRGLLVNQDFPCVRLGVNYCSISVTCSLRTVSCVIRQHQDQRLVVGVARVRSHFMFYYLRISSCVIILTLLVICFCSSCTVLMQLNLCSYLAFVVSRYCTLFVMFVLLEKVELDLSHSCWWVWNSLYWTVRRGLIYRIIGGLCVPVISFVLIPQYNKT